MYLPSPQPSPLKGEGEKNESLTDLKGEGKKIDAILIDDDDLVRTMWKLEAKSKNKKIITYTSANEFFKDSDQYHIDTQIYVDSNLGDGIKGQDVSKEIHQKGFKHIYLATGYNKSEFPEMPWIKDVIGKDFPLRNI